MPQTFVPEQVCDSRCRCWQRVVLCICGIFRESWWRSARSVAQWVRLGTSLCLSKHSCHSSSIAVLRRFPHPQTDFRRSSDSPELALEAKSTNSGAETRNIVETHTCIVRSDVIRCWTLPLQGAWMLVVGRRISKWAWALLPYCQRRKAARECKCMDTGKISRYLHCVQTQIYWIRMSENSQENASIKLDLLGLSLAAHRYMLCSWPSPGFSHLWAHKEF